MSLFQCSGGSPTEPRDGSLPSLQDSFFLSPLPQPWRVFTSTPGVGVEQFATPPRRVRAGSWQVFFLLPWPWHQGALSSACHPAPRESLEPPLFRIWLRKPAIIFATCENST